MTQPPPGWRQRRNAVIAQMYEMGLYVIPLKGKEPYRTAWQQTKSYSGKSLKQIQALFSANDNVGLLTGIPFGGENRFLRGIDYDKLDLWEEHVRSVAKSDGKEFWWLTKGVITKSGKGYHHYVLSDEPEKWVFAGGEIQGARQQLVIPPSIHPETQNEYQFFMMNWDQLPFVPASVLREHYPPIRKSWKKKEKAAPKEKNPLFTAQSPQTLESFLDYNTIDFIRLFSDRGWVVADKGESVYVLCPNRSQHSTDTDGTSSTAILRLDSGGQRFKCLHAHCDHLVDRDELVKFLGGDEAIRPYAEPREPRPTISVQEADPDFQRRWEEHCRRQRAEAAETARPDSQQLDEIAERQRQESQVRTPPPALLSPPGDLGKIVQWMNASTPNPVPILHVGASLAFAGSLLGHAYIGLNGARPQIYVVGLAPTGAGKEHARTVIRNLADAALISGRVIDGTMSSQRALEIALENRQGRMLWMLDEFGKAMAPILSGSQSVSSQQASIAELIMKLDGLLNSTYEGQKYADGSNKQQGKHSVRIRFPVLSLYGTTAPGRYLDMLTPALVDDGYINRFLHLRSWDPIPVHRPLNGEFLAADPPEEIVQIIRQWESLSLEDGQEINCQPFTAEEKEFVPRKPRYLHADDDAVSAFEEFERMIAEWKDRLNQEIPNSGDLLARSSWKAKKVALILAAADSRPVVDGEIMRYACDLVKYGEEEITNFLPSIEERGTGDPRRGRQMKSLFSYIDRREQVGCTLKDLANRFRTIPKALRKEYLETMVESGELVLTLEGEGKKKANRFFSARWAQTFAAPAEEDEETEKAE